jgi:uncharacterized integral membrane protein
MVQDKGATTPQQQNAGLGAGAILSIGGIAALVVFMAQNTQDVTVHFLAFKFTWPLWLLILVSSLIGALVWFGAGVLRRHRRRVRRREERRE